MTLPSKTLFALGISSAIFLAQATDQETRFKAKYGRNTPAVEKQRSDTAYRDAKPPAAAATAPRDNWSEDRHQSKMGRPTPAEESRISAEKSNTAYREVTAPPADRWHDNYVEGKLGRSAPNKK